MTTTTGPQLADAIVAISQRINDHKNELNRLDAALGDGDHGTGISAGFSAAAKRAQALENPTPTAVLKTTAMALMNRGGSSGALYGAFFLKASLWVDGKRSLEALDWAEMFQAGLQGVMQRGKAQLGDKTLVDALHPAVSAMRESLQANQPLSEVFRLAAQAAHEGAEATTDMVARVGRAKFTGERAIGHKDAGAASIALMFQVLSDVQNTK